MNPEQCTLLSINVGQPRPIQIGETPATTGCFKEPVTGPVEVRRDGVTEDHIGDRKRHGGPDQAIYLFSAEDAAWWSQRLQRDVPAGYFGENFTLERWWADVRVGDRIRFGSLLLELTFPRVPCATLAARVGDPAFLKRFVAAKRPGVYARVLVPGGVAAGAQGSILRAPAAYPSTVELFELWHHKPKDAALLRRSLQAPVAARARPMFTQWLDAQAGLVSYDERNGLAAGCTQEQTSTRPVHACVRVWRREKASHAEHPWCSGVESFPLQRQLQGRRTMWPPPPPLASRRCASAA